MCLLCCDVVVSDSDFEFVEPQTLSRECGVGVGQKMDIEGPRQKLCRSPSGEDPRRKVRFTKAVPDCMRSKASRPPDGTPLQQTATWPGPPKDPSAEVKEMEVEDANPPWTGRTSAHRPNGERLAEERGTPAGNQLVGVFLAWSGRWRCQCHVLRRKRAGRRRIQQDHAARCASRQGSGGCRAPWRSSKE